MYNLEKKDHTLFNNYFIGFNDKTNIKITCILDDWCVRYCVYNLKDGTSRRHEFSNSKKELCFKHALKKLNESK